MNKQISISLITLFAAFGLPLVGYANSCYPSLEMTVINKSSNDLKIADTSQYCSCGPNSPVSKSDSLSNLYPQGYVLKAGESMHGFIYVESGGSCGTSDTGYVANFDDGNDNIYNNYTLWFSYKESAGSHVDHYDAFGVADGAPYTIKETYSSAECADNYADTTCVKELTISNK